MATRAAVSAMGLRSECARSMVRSAASALGLSASCNPYGSVNFSRAAAAPGYALPGPRMPLGYVVVNGQRLPVEIDPAYWRLFRHMWDDRLGGMSGPSMGEVQTNVEATKAQAVNAVVTAAAVEQLATTNAEALKATVQVAQNAGLAGASNIPEVVLRPSSTSYLEP